MNKYEKYWNTKFETKGKALKSWTDEDIIKITKVADMMWEQKIEAKIQELEEKHKDYKTTINVLEELLKGE